MVVAFVLGIVAFGTATKTLAQGGPDVPLQFKMIGQFYDPAKDKTAGGVNAFTVNVKQKQWILDIESSHTLQGSMLGSSVLKQIYPPIMTFVGPDELTRQLMGPEIEGKTYTMTGQLYVKRRLFRLTGVEGPEEEDQAEPENPDESGAANKHDPGT
jgi:hypothetical protein